MGFESSKTNSLFFENEAFPIYAYCRLNIKMLVNDFSNERCNVSFSDHKLTKSDRLEHIFLKFKYNFNTIFVAELRFGLIRN